MQTLDLLRKLPRPLAERDAWSYGVDCALNGANAENSHFSIFRTQERKDAWAAGKAAAEKYLAEHERIPANELKERGLVEFWENYRPQPNSFQFAARLTPAVRQALESIQPAA